MRGLVLILVGALLAACAETSLRPVAAPAEAMIAQQNWLGAIRYYQTALTNDPDNAELRRGYLAVAESAVTHYVTEARRFADLQDFSSAQLQLQQGLAAVPDSTLLREEIERIGDLRQSRVHFRDAVASARLGRRTQAMTRVEAALALDPEYDDALDLLERLNAQAAADSTVQPIRLRTSAPVTVNFRNAGFKEAALALGQAYGVNMIFDADLEDRSISLFAEDVSFAQAFELLLKSNRSFYRRLGRNSVVIAPDTPEGRAAYEDYLVRTFYLSEMDATTAADLVSRSLGITNVTANEGCEFHHRARQPRAHAAGFAIDRQQRPGTGGGRDGGRDPRGQPDQERTTRPGFRLADHRVASSLDGRRLQLVGRGGGRHQREYPQPACRHLPLLQAGRGRQDAGQPAHPHHQQARGADPYRRPGTLEILDHSGRHRARPARPSSTATSASS